MSELLSKNNLGVTRSVTDILKSLNHPIYTILKDGKLITGKPLSSIQPNYEVSAFWSAINRSINEIGVPLVGTWEVKKWVATPFFRNVVAPKMYDLDTVYYSGNGRYYLGSVGRNPRNYPYFVVSRHVEEDDYWTTVPGIVNPKQNWLYTSTVEHSEFLNNLPINETLNKLKNPLEETGGGGGGGGGSVRPEEGLIYPRKV